jgi:hypothetical protein
MPPNGALDEEEEGDSCEELEVEETEVEETEVGETEVGETEGELDTGETRVEERTPAVGAMDGT